MRAGNVIFFSKFIKPQVIVNATNLFKKTIGFALSFVELGINIKNFEMLEKMCLKLNPFNHKPLKLYASLFINFKSAALS